MKLGKIDYTWHFNAKVLLTGALVAFAYGCSAQEICLESVGARFGFNPFGAGHDFYQAEGFVNWNLPWRWDLGSSLNLQSRVDVSAGWLAESGASAAIASAGPSLVLRKESFPLSLEAGLSPTELSRSDFRSKDFGIPFQFTSHGGLNFDITSHICISYRFQHMSNASLSRHNPGLNLNMLGLSYQF